MAKAPLRVVLDTNILVSSFVFGGVPRKILSFVLAEEIYAVTSKFLLAELFNILREKFDLAERDIQLIKSQMDDNFKIVYPSKEIHIVRDVEDNRVLEAAVKGKCEVIVTGDKDLLILKKYKNIKILLPSEFLEEFL